MTIKSKEFSDLMKQFELTVGKYMNHNKEEKELWGKGYFYTNGETNDKFKMFWNGYQFAKSLARIEALPLNG
jgi:hypothetical protein